MPKVNLADSLEHGLVSAIRNFSIAEKALAEPEPNALFARKLLRASIEQLEKSLSELRNTEKHESTAAHSNRGKAI